jgi:hypothetical protein
MNHWKPMENLMMTLTKCETAYNLSDYHCFITVSDF